MAGGPIAWLAKKQTCMAKSTRDAEFIAISYAASYVIWARGLCYQLQLRQYTDKPTPILCDSTSAIALAKNPIQDCNSKSVRIKFI